MDIFNGLAFFSQLSGKFKFKVLHKQSTPFKGSCFHLNKTLGILSKCSVI